jgi:DNA-binding transcriptional regulator YdaS (Cro superfamily)
MNEETPYSPLVERIRGAVAKKLNRAVTEVSHEVMAEYLGVSAMAVSQWRRRGFSAERVVELERLTEIPRHEFRPDLWDAPYECNCKGNGNGSKAA